jgi:hypothetical protein
MGLGIDLFTYRGICQNGAVFGYGEIGNDFMRHFGKNTEKITNNMSEMIKDNLGRFEDIKNFYDAMASKKLGENNRKSIFKKLEPHVPFKSFPDYVEIEKVKLNKDSAIDHIYSIKKEARNYSMWKVFNDLTENVWHNKKLRMDAKREQTLKIHQIVIDSLSYRVN